MTPDMYHHSMGVAHLGVASVAVAALVAVLIVAAGLAVVRARSHG